jgi:hypothetical protein
MLAYVVLPVVVSFQFILDYRVLQDSEYSTKGKKVKQIERKRFEMFPTLKYTIYYYEVQLYYHSSTVDYTYTLHRVVVGGAYSENSESSTLQYYCTRYTVSFSPSHNVVGRLVGSRIEY